MAEVCIGPDDECKPFKKKRKKGPRMKIDWNFLKRKKRRRHDDDEEATASGMFDVPSPGAFGTPKVKMKY
jgi:hypothetical protein